MYTCSYSFFKIIVFAKSVILEESGVFVYREETITVNYTSNGSYSGPHGFVLEYYIGMSHCNPLALFKQRFEFWFIFYHLLSL